MFSLSYPFSAATILPPQWGQMKLFGASPTLNLHWEAQFMHDANRTSSSSLFFMAIRMAWSARTGCISSLDLTIPSNPMADTVPGTTCILPSAIMETTLSLFSMSRSSHRTLFTASLYAGVSLWRSKSLEKFMKRWSASFSMMPNFLATNTNLHLRNDEFRMVSLARASTVPGLTDATVSMMTSLWTFLGSSRIMRYGSAVIPTLSPRRAVSSAE